MKKCRVALIHDYLNQYGGAERVLESLHNLFPDAPVFTSLYDRQKMRSFGFDDSGWDIRTSFMQHIPGRESLPRFYFTGLYPLAFSSFNLEGYDLIISDSSYASKNIRKPKGSVHICYCHTPPRFLYGFDQETNVSAMNSFEQGVSKTFVPFLRKLDQGAGKRVDYFIANSKVVQKRIRSIYNRESVVIYPPVNTDRFKAPLTKPKGVAIDKPYFLVISRLGDYKRVDIVVEAFNNLGLELKIIGSGPRFDYLKILAGKTIELLGRLNDPTAAYYLQNCIALIFPTEEDFGITPLESLSAGKPVIAYKAGGTLETLNSSCAAFFTPQSASALEKAVKNFDPSVYNPNTCKKQAEAFNEGRFAKELIEFVEGIHERN